MSDEAKSFTMTVRAEWRGSSLYLCGEPVGRVCEIRPSAKPWRTDLGLQSRAYLTQEAARAAVEAYVRERFGATNEASK